MESLSPESRALYEILMAETTEAYESRFLAHKKEILDVVRVSIADNGKKIKALYTQMSRRISSRSRRPSVRSCDLSSSRSVRRSRASRRR
jgi:hypothetical protein